MFWRLWRRSDILDRGEAARHLHETWLSRAMLGGKSYPRIPVRPVDEGGFSVLRSTAYGADVSEAWWTMALEQVDIPDEARGSGRTGQG